MSNGVAEADGARAIKRLIFQYHPDRAMDEATRAKYEEITKQLTGRYRAARQAPVAAVGTERLAIGFRDP
ncbi:MAG: hypothetical protein ACLFUA_14485, partial [Spirochaetales bacterium]